MALILREPVSEIQFLQHDPESQTSLPIPAGRLMRIVGDGLVDILTDASAQVPVGFLMQRIKAEYTDIPTFARFRSDFGSSDAFLGDPVGIAAGNGAVYETDQYVDTASNGIAAGTLLYPNDSGKLEDTDAASSLGPAAMALKSLTASQTAAGKLLLIKALV
jgi:hypothetical protein